MADRINWAALRSACQNLNLHDLDEVCNFTSAGYTPAEAAAGHVFEVVASAGENGAVKEGDLKALHHVLFEIHVLEGELVCPESGRRFFVRDGIPNMLLHEDELGGSEPTSSASNDDVAS